jgi:hypothetical protein
LLAARAIASVGMALPLAAVGCTSDDASIYFIQPDDDWALKEAINPETGTPAQPSLDWYAEYERFPAPDRSERVVVSGHDADRLRTELLAFGLRPAQVHGVDGEVGSGPDGKPEVAIFEPQRGYAVMGLSYDVDRSGLVAWMAELRQVSEDQWIGAGGRVAG